MNDYFFEAFEGLSQLGPGSKETTFKAASFINKDEPLTILDVGCGTGRQTLYLAEIFPQSTIIAVDTHLPFLESLDKKIAEQHLGNRVETLCVSMDELSFEEHSFDIIWAEGSIYIIGFDRGLKEWKRFLKPGGVLACNEICWLTENRSKELNEFWSEEYPEIDTIKAKLESIERNRYAYMTHFVLPPSDWITHYYEPLEENLAKMKKKYSYDQDAEEVIKANEYEIDLYRRFSDYYGYVFFLMENN